MARFVSHPLLLRSELALRRSRSRNSADLRRFVDLDALEALVEAAHAVDLVRLVDFFDLGGIVAKVIEP